MHQLPLCGHCFGPSSPSGARSCPPSPLLLRLLSWPLVKEGVGGSSIRCRGSRRQPGHTWLVWDSFQIIVERLLELINGALCHISQKWGQAVKKLSTVHLKSLLSCCSCWSFCPRFNFWDLAFSSLSLVSKSWGLYPAVWGQTLQNFPCVHDPVSLLSSLYRGHL